RWYRGDRSQPHRTWAAADAGEILVGADVRHPEEPFLETGPATSGTQRLTQDFPMLCLHGATTPHRARLQRRDDFSVEVTDHELSPAASFHAINDSMIWQPGVSAQTARAFGCVFHASRLADQRAAIMRPPELARLRERGRGRCGCP